MAEMFDGMLKATRYVGYRAPEYLRTHPLTESRVNGAMARARLYPQKHYPENPLYSLMRVRVDVSASGSPEQALAKIQAGASAIQLYSAMVFQGMSLVADIIAGLDDAARTTPLHELRGTATDDWL